MLSLRLDTVDAPEGICQRKGCLRVLSRRFFQTVSIDDGQKLEEGTSVHTQLILNSFFRIFI